MSRKWRSWYQNEVDENIKGVYSRDGEAQRNERSVIFREYDIGGRARVTTDEELVL